MSTTAMVLSIIGVIIFSLILYHKKLAKAGWKYDMCSDGYLTAISSPFFLNGRFAFLHQDGNLTAIIKDNIQLEMTIYINDKPIKYAIKHLLDDRYLLYPKSNSSFVCDQLYHANKNYINVDGSQISLFNLRAYMKYSFWSNKQRNIATITDELFHDLHKKT